MNCSILSSSHFLTRELRGKCNQSCQQYRSDNSISPKPPTKRFLIFRIELLIFIDHLSAHRTPPSLYGAKKCTPCMAGAAVMAITKWLIFWLGKMTRARKKAPGAARGFECITKEKWPRGNEPLDASILSQGTNQAR